MGKGSIPRPFNVTNEEYANRWDAIFGRDNEKKNEAQSLESTESHTTRPNGGSDNSTGKAESTQDA